MTPFTLGWFQNIVNWLSMIELGQYCLAQRNACTIQSLLRAPHGDVLLERDAVLLRVVARGVEARPVHLVADALDGPPLPLVLRRDLVPVVDEVGAGLLEIVWALGLKYTHGFTRPLPSAITIAALVSSIWLLASTAKTLPIGTAYAVWVGIGAVGTALGGIVLMGEQVPPPGRRRGQEERRPDHRRRIGGSREGDQGR